MKIPTKDYIKDAGIMSTKIKKIIPIIVFLILFMPRITAEAKTKLEKIKKP